MVEPGGKQLSGFQPPRPTAVRVLKSRTGAARVNWRLRCFWLATAGRANGAGSAKAWAYHHQGQLLADRVWPITLMTEFNHGVEGPKFAAPCPCALQHQAAA
jgi:hypothetical protein